MKRIQDKTNVVAPNATYPYGNMKDNTGSNDGTPADTEFMVDMLQLSERMLAESGITANGLPDNDVNGFQLYEAFIKLTKPYKSYTALMTQSGTSAPTATVLGLNEIGSIVWTYSGVGQYTGTLSGAFVAGKTYLYIHSGQGGGIEQRLDRLNSNDVLIGAYISGLNANSGMGGTSLEIRVYD